MKRATSILFFMAVMFTLTAQTWECGQPFTDSRDGNIYPTVMINGQCWMAKNLNYGTIITYPTPQTAGTKYCYGAATYTPAQLQVTCNLLGGFYDWNNLMNYSEVEGSQGICPNDWHIATYPEWKAIVDTWGDSLAGAHLKEAGVLHWQNLGSTYYGTYLPWQKPPSWRPDNSTGMTVVGSGFIGGGFNYGYGYKLHSTIYTSSLRLTSELPIYQGQPPYAVPVPVAYDADCYDAKFQAVCHYRDQPAPVRCVHD